jgi:predicted MPP superfamily phosphohydrolase
MSLWRYLFFLLVVLGVDAALHSYLWARIVRDPALPAGWARGLTLVLWTLATSPVLAMMAMRAPRVVSAPLGWVAMIWLGLAFHALLLFGLLDVARAIAWAARRGVEIDADRRAFLARVGGGLVGASLVALGGWSLREGLRPVAVERVRVPLAKLPRALSGYTIAQISDVHIGPTIGRAFLEDVVRKVNALAPDLVVITGDLVDGTVDALREHVAPLRDLRARDGVYFVTGNHEYYSGADAWIAHLAELGVRVLRNERVPLRDGLDLAGVDDWTAASMLDGHGHDLERALEGRDPSRALVLLAHQPKAAPEAARKGVDLVLCGHTHGGQLWPFHYLVRLAQPFLAGLHRLQDTYVYVSRGTGYWGPPMRLGAPSEVTRVELEAVSPAGGSPTHPRRRSDGRMRFGIPPFGDAAVAMCAGGASAGGGGAAGLGRGDRRVGVRA